MIFPLNVNVVIILLDDNLSKKPYACLPQFTSICISSAEAMLADWKSQSMILCVLVSSRMQKSIVFKKDTLCYKIANIKYGDRQPKKSKKTTTKLF